jgi:outer membrane protein
MRFTAPLILVFSILSLPLTAQQSYSLKQAQEYALKNSPVVINKQLEKEIASKKVWELTASGLPQVEATGNFQNFIDIPTTVVPANAFNPMAPSDELVGLRFGTDYNVTGAITVNQLIFNGSYFVGLQASKTYQLLAEKDVKKAELEVKEMVAQSYYSILILQENLLILDSSFAKMQKLLVDTKILAENKVIESTDADQLEVNVLTVKNAVDQMKRQLEVSKNLLKLNMGLPLDVEVVLTDDASVFVQVLNPESAMAVSFDVQNNIDYQLMQVQFSLARLDMKNKQAGYMPSLGAFFNHQQQAFRNDFDFFDKDKNWFPATIWGLSLQVPIFSSGMRMSQVSQARIKTEQVQTAIEQLENSLKVQSLKLQSDFSGALDTYENEKKKAEVTAEILRKTEIKFKEKVASGLELTQVQNQYLNAEASRVNALYNLITTKIALDKLYGKL